MLQFYLLSVVMNALAGFILVTRDESDILEFKGGFSFRDETFRFVAGILSLVTGLLKILSPVQGDLPVVGDLVPAAAGFFAGFILIFEYYRNRTTAGASESSEKINRILVSNKKIIGLAALAAAALHFLFPGVLLF